jgi:hypothetical protein
MLPSDFALLYYFCCLYTYSHREHSNNFYRESGFLSHIPRFTKKHCVWKFPRLGQFVFTRTVAATCTWRWVWGIGGMILTGENRRTRRKFYAMLPCRPHMRHGLTLDWSRSPSTPLTIVQPNCYRRNHPRCLLLGAQLTFSNHGNHARCAQKTRLCHKISAHVTFPMGIFQE